MSVFRGSITEYPGVIIDRFVAFNCERGRAFFLSHCHKDHMTGLGTPALVEALHRRNASLYCSDVTRSLLLRDPDFSHLAAFLKTLPMEEPVSMTLGAFADSKAVTFTVTLLPAGHCPGSAMFLFQGSNGNVLYTGDFRLTLEETKHLQPLHLAGSVLPIDTLYLDTTFCHPIATEIPSREVSRDHILELIESWLTKSPQNAVRLHCAMFGYEHIYMGVARKFNTKVHVASWRLNAYAVLPAVAQCITADGQSTRIHACNFPKGAKKHEGLPCGSWVKSCRGRPPNVLTIKPSTQWFLFSNKSIEKPYVYLPECNAYRVLHSMHASYSELRDFVSYVRPRRIVPCVVPSGDQALTDVHTRLKDLIPRMETFDKAETNSTKIVETCLTGAQQSSVVRQTRKRRRQDSGSSDTNTERSTDKETIDEFLTSEEQSVNTSLFTRASTRSNHHPSVTAGLPSMLVHPQASPSIGPSTQQSSILSLELSDPVVSSSDSVTVGSLQQTSLDLSFDSNGASDADTPLQVKGHGDNVSLDSDKTPTVLSVMEPCRTPSSKRRKLERSRQTAYKDVDDSGTPTTVTRSPRKTPRRLFPRRSSSPCSPIQSSRESDVYVLTCQSTEYIDLTRDEDEEELSLSSYDNLSRQERHKATYSRHMFTGTSDLDHHHKSVNRPQSVTGYSTSVARSDRERGHERQGGARDCHDVIVLSDSPSSTANSSSDGRQNPEVCGHHSDSEDTSRESPVGGSPLFLPPTPGREEVESILQRKSIAFPQTHPPQP